MVHNPQNKLIYPQEFKGRTYGTLFNSLIFTFKLRNAYLTNLVKCGLNNDNEEYRGIYKYNYECVSTCYENYLSKEIELVDPKVVFCFGSSVYDHFYDLYPDDFPFPVITLPHPAGQRRGFKNEFYRHLYFSMVLEGLYKASIISKKEAANKYREFLL